MPVVVAAGNSADNANMYPPANCSNVIAVGAADENGQVASYSNTGPNVDVLAPGGHGTRYSIISTIDAGTTGPTRASYGYKNGTSMATPFVSGTVHASTVTVGEVVLPASLSTTMLVLFVVVARDGATTLRLSSVGDFIALPDAVLPARPTGIVVVVLLAALTALSLWAAATARR